MQDHFKKPYPFDPQIVIAIDEVIEKKVDALDAHSSQMYEWGPWTNGGDASVAKVPTDKKERREWLSKRVKRNPGNMSEARRASLEKWYGSDASSVQYTEAFEIAEYGFQPRDEDILRFFPYAQTNQTIKNEEEFRHCWTDFIDILCHFFSYQYNRAPGSGHHRKF